MPSEEADGISDLTMIGSPPGVPATMRNDHKANIPVRSLAKSNRPSGDQPIGIFLLW
jgi:hypothetical protein